MGFILKILFDFHTTVCCFNINGIGSGPGYGRMLLFKSK